jgi:hypothetical protein
LWPAPCIIHLAIQTGKAHLGSVRRPDNFRTMARPQINRGRPETCGCLRKQPACLMPATRMISSSSFDHTMARTSSSLQMPRPWRNWGLLTLWKKIRRPKHHRSEPGVIHRQPLKSMAPEPLPG